MVRGRHIKHRARTGLVVAIAVGVVVVALGGVSFAAYRYDRASAGRILPGVTVAGADVGGMTRAEALEVVRAVADQRLKDPILIRAAKTSWSLTPSELGETADIEAAVDSALAESASAGFLTRVWHRLRDEPVDIAIDLSYATTGTEVQAFLSRATSDVAQSPRDASVAVLDGTVTFVHSRPGHSLGVHIAARRLQAALAAGATTVRMPMNIVRPKIPDAKIGKTIVVDRTVNKLYFYNRFDLIHTFDVATAADGYVTPAGDWTIVDKQENPTWTNPAPDTWGADLPASIPPGPGNPLGTRALYLNAPGIRIHGTYDVGSIGTHASHGCIRMLISDVEELYPLVPIGTRVIVF
jgi:lipoprotein-anchoring transpeptidase ErfK/SrfK